MRLDRSGFASVYHTAIPNQERRSSHGGTPDILAPFRRRPARAGRTRPPRSYDERRRAMSSVVKKRRKKMRKHKHRKMLKKTRWQRKHKG